MALELGGKSASIICEDADLAAAVKGSAGQTCTAHTRMLVPESRYEEAAKIAVAVTQAYTVGDPMEETSTMGPVASKSQRDRVQEYIQIGLDEGAELLCGGLGAPEGLDRRGFYVKPTVFGRVKSGSRLAQEEVFGPVLSIITYTDEADAVRIANDSIYGLSGGVWASTDERATEVESAGSQRRFPAVCRAHPESAGHVAARAAWACLAALVAPAGWLVMNSPHAPDTPGTSLQQPLCRRRAAVRALHGGRHRAC